MQRAPSHKMAPRGFRRTVALSQRPGKKQLCLSLWSVQCSFDTAWAVVVVIKNASSVELQQCVPVPPSTDLSRCGVHDGAITKAQGVMFLLHRGANHANEAGVAEGVVVGVRCGFCRLVL